MTGAADPTAAAAGSKKAHVVRAMLAQEANRFDDMAEHMRRAAQSGEPMSKDEDALLSVAYKHVVDAKRSARRTLASVEEQWLEQGRERTGGDDDDDDDDDDGGGGADAEDAAEWRWKAAEARRYRDLVDGELRALCADALAVVRDRQAAAEVRADAAADVFYWKLRADYNRYAAESAEDAAAAGRAAAVAESRDAYERADRLARQRLSPVDPLRLGLALNYSVFLYQMGRERRLARDVAAEAFNGAVAQVDVIDDDDDAMHVIRLIRDNLTVWAEDEEENAGGGGGNAPRPQAAPTLPGAEF